MKSLIFKKSFMGAAVGTMIEYYDYGLFLFFLPLLSSTFFPGETAYDALLFGYVVSCISLLIRPIGGIVFGQLGDLLGRKNTLLLSMYGIAAATFAIGLMPSYSAVGSFAILGIIIAKAIQGFCFAGEFNGAAVYVIEHAPTNRKIFASSLLTAVMLSGAFLSAFVGVIITHPSMPSWCWRLAFVFGGILGLFGIFYRKNMYESPEFKSASTTEFPLKNLFLYYKRELITGICIGGLSTVPYTTVLTFINPVLMTEGYFKPQTLMFVQLIVAFFSIVALLTIGLIADRTSSFKVMLLGAISLLVLPYPLLLCVDHHILWLLIPALSSIVILNEIFLGPANAYLASLFPVNFRYRGSSFSFSCGMAIFGGITPLIENYLYKSTGTFSSLALWIGFICICTLVAMYDRRTELKNIHQEPFFKVLK